MAGAKVPEAWVGQRVVLAYTDRQRKVKGTLQSVEERGVVVRFEVAGDEPGSPSGLPMLICWPLVACMVLIEDGS